MDWAVLQARLLLLLVMVAMQAQEALVAQQHLALRLQ